VILSVISRDLVALISYQMKCIISQNLLCDVPGKKQDPQSFNRW